MLPLHNITRKFANVAAASEMVSTVIVTFQEDNYRIEVYRDANEKNPTPFHVRIYDQALEQADGDEDEPQENGKTVVVSMWRELLYAPDCKADTLESALHKAIKVLSEAE